jgi:hypothetical protein
MLSAFLNCAKQTSMYVVLYGLSIIHDLYKNVGFTPPVLTLHSPRKPPSCMRKVLFPHITAITYTYATDCNGDVAFENMLTAALTELEYPADTAKYQTAECLYHHVRRGFEAYCLERKNASGKLTGLLTWLFSTPTALHFPTQIHITQNLILLQLTATTVPFDSSLVDDTTHVVYTQLCV